MIKQGGNVKFFRSMVYISSLIFLIVLLFIFQHQQGWINGIVNNYFDINVRSILMLFSASDMFQTLKEYFVHMGIEIGGLIVLEGLIIVTCLCLIGYFLVKLKRIDRWYVSEKMLVGGYLFLVVSAVVIKVKMGVEVYQTYNTVVQRVNQLSVQEVLHLQTEFTNVFINSSFSVDRLIADFASLFEQIRTNIQKTNEIAGIPSVLRQSWDQIFMLKNGLMVCVTAAVFVLFAAHGLALFQWIKMNDYVQLKLTSRKRARQIEMNEQLVTVIKQQKELIELLSKKE